MILWNTNKKTYNDRSKVAYVKIINRALHTQLFTNELCIEESYNIDWDQVSDVVKEQEKEEKMKQPNNNIHNNISMVYRLKHINGCTIMHYACRNERAPESLIHSFLMQQQSSWNPKTILQDDDGCCLLHYACRYRTSETIVRKLIELYPPAVQYKNNEGQYPFHCACIGRKSIDLVLHLWELFPTISVTDTDRSEVDLFYYVCESVDLYKSLVYKFLQLHPQLIQRKDRFNQYPLHVVCSSSHDMRNHSDIVLQMIHLFPKAVSHGNCFDHYPLHLVCMGKYCYQVVDELIEIYPEAIEERDDCGHCPFDYSP